MLMKEYKLIYKTNGRQKNLWNVHT